MADNEKTTTGRFEAVAFPTVLGGAYIPAHDMTFDCAEAIGRFLDRFHAYVSEVREPEQAGNATIELLKAFLTEAESERNERSD